jgi:hypothetical protein
MVLRRSLWVPVPLGPIDVFFAQDSTYQRHAPLQFGSRPLIEFAEQHFLPVSLSF